MAERPIDEPLVIIEYRMRPGPGEWVSYSGLLAQLIAWAVIPSAGPPAVTVSKRVTVKGPEEGGVDPTEPGSMLAALYPDGFARTVAAFRKRGEHACTCWEHTPSADDGEHARTAATEAAPRRCCYIETGTCATCRNGGPIGRCCFPLQHVCPLHH